MEQKLPEKVRVGKKEMPGFSYAAQLPLKQTTWEPLPPEAYEKPKRKVEPASVRSLRDALDLFTARVPCYRINEVKLEGVRIGVVYRSGEAKYLVLFKRNVYYHFSEHFPNVPVKGYGVVCNLKLVHWCALEGVRVAVVLPEAKCYWVDGKKFWDFYEEHKTDVPDLREEIASPFSMWERLF